MRTYTNSSTGMKVLMGTIKSISEDRRTMVVTTQEMDRSKNEYVPVEYTVKTQIPFEDDYKVGFDVTAAGYGHGKGTIMAEAVLIGNSYYDDAELAIVKGFVKKAGLKSEKNEDGTPKTKRDGSIRKPHYDVTVAIHEGDKWVDHIIKLYDGNTPAGKKSMIDRAQAMFGRFDRETNRIKVTFVTAPGTYESKESVGKDGKTYINNYCYHLGAKAIDIEYVDQKEKDKSTPEKAVTKPTPERVEPVQDAPQQGNGFSAMANAVEMDDLSEWN